ncbi:hypothetical protein BYT27DRAFT_7238462 [Phlegmacium glaucopus]|nr:hypothetical protein BYT27DRAFT_7238462 [Phlegmacium glaucopus]
MASPHFVLDGTYSIRSATSNDTYLTRGSTTGNRVVAGPRSNLNNNASQLWTLSRGSDGDYEIRSPANAQELLRVDLSLNQLFCSASGRRVTWNIEPRGSISNTSIYVIGDAANGNAIQLPNRSGPNGLNGGARQRWILEPDASSPQNILNSLHGAWRIYWGTNPSEEGLLVLQISNRAAQGNGHDTMGRRYTCRVRHVSGNRVQFDYSMIRGTAPLLAYEATISADCRTIIGIMSIQYTRIQL